jgi:hypothetical protein
MTREDLQQPATKEDLLYMADLLSKVVEILVEDGEPKRIMIQNLSSYQRQIRTSALVDD